MNSASLAVPRAKLGSPGLKLIAFTAAILTSACLLFLVEPMFAKLLLPSVGGAPAVWTTAVLFFQVVLLLAYGYAHVLTQRLQRRSQVGVHAAVLCLPLLVLPLHLVGSGGPASGASPVLWVLAVLTVSVGLPFFALSATSPLLQRWFTGTGHPHASDPYFLYRASNAGSLLALVAYPTLVEPHVGLTLQTRLWTAAYVVLAVLVAGCGVILWRTVPHLDPQVPARVAASAVPVLRRLRWTALAAVPALWMLALTSYFTTVILPMPLLWVIPLAIYLGTFALAFAPRPWLSRRLLTRVLPFLALPLAGSLLLGATGPLGFLALLHVSAFFVAALLCHTELAADRPGPAGLTGFYFWVALGGVAGGAFSALAAPFLFRSYAEYPLAIVAACLLKPSIDLGWSRRERIKDVVLPLGLGLFTVGVATAIALSGVASATSGPTVSGVPLGELVRRYLLFSVPAVVCFSFSYRSVRFGLGLLAIFLASVVPLPGQQQPLFAARDFFGVHQVVLSPDGSQHQLIDGGIIHGLQLLDPARRDEPTAFYTTSGPLGDFFAARAGSAVGGDVAVIGLGAGTAACYATPAENWTFYEIDPTIERIATNPRLFTFLRDCTGSRGRVIIGDGRLEIARAGEGTFGAIVVDAFGSDTVPVHLLTREAASLYMSRLKEGGSLIFHVSNQYTDLRPVLSNVAASLGLVCYGRVDVGVGADAFAGGRYPSSWVVITRHRESLGALLADPRWGPVPVRADEAAWTDDYSDVLRSMQLR